MIAGVKRNHTTPGSLILARGDTCLFMRAMARAGLRDWLFSAHCSATIFAVPDANMRAMGYTDEAINALPPDDLSNLMYRHIVPSVSPRLMALGYEASTINHCTVHVYRCESGRIAVTVSGFSAFVIDSTRLTRGARAAVYSCDRLLGRSLACNDALARTTKWMTNDGAFLPPPTPLPVNARAIDRARAMMMKAAEQLPPKKRLDSAAARERPAASPGALSIGACRSHATVSRGTQTDAEPGESDRAVLDQLSAIVEGDKKAQPRS